MRLLEIREDPMSSDMVIRGLNTIILEHEGDVERQVEGLLQLGLDRFGLDIGVVSQIEDSSYRLAVAVAPAGIDLLSGERFELDDSYCSMTVAANGPIGFQHAGASSFAQHPSYGAFKLEAYIGVPIYRGSTLYGTLSFSSTRPRARTFDEVDLDCLEFLGGWLSALLRLQEVETQLNGAVSQSSESRVAKEEAAGAA